MNDAMISITLEGDTQTYNVSRAKLLGVSEYFVKALTGGFSESKTLALKLPDCTADTLQMFLYYLSSGKELVDLFVPHFDYDREAQATLARVWVFGQQYLIPKLQDEAMKALDELLQDHLVGLDTVRVAFTKTSEHSKLRNRITEEMYRDHGEVFQKASTSREQRMAEVAAIPGYLIALSEEMARVHQVRKEEDDGGWISRTDLKHFLVSEI